MNLENHLISTNRGTFPGTDSTTEDNRAHGGISVFVLESEASQAASLRHGRLPIGATCFAFGRSFVLPPFHTTAVHISSRDTARSRVHFNTHVARRMGSNTRCEENHVAV